MSVALIDTKIAQSPHHTTYSHWLRNGMPNRACERKAKELFNEDISYEAFRRYKLNMSPDEIAPNVLPYGEYDLDIDEAKHLMALILLVEQRLVAAYEVEKKLNGLTLERVDSLMKLLLMMLVKLAQMKTETIAHVNIKTQINQQFNGNSGSQSAYVHESDEEYRQRIMNIIAKANKAATATRHKE